MKKQPEWYLDNVHSNMLTESRNYYLTIIEYEELQII